MQKCKLNVTHWISMNDEEILTPVGRLHLAQKQHYTYVQWNSCPHLLQSHESKLKVKANSMYRDFHQTNKKKSQAIKFAAKFRFHSSYCSILKNNSSCIHWRYQNHFSLNTRICWCCNYSYVIFYNTLRYQSLLDQCVGIYFGHDRALSIYSLKNHT